MNQTVDPTPSTGVATPRPVRPSGAAWRRRMTWVDRLLAEAGRALQVLDGSVTHQRPYPAGPAMGAEAPLSDSEARHAAGLMRVNHVGEICAQALYRGQALWCRDEAVRKVMLHAAEEEADHLAWCHQRLEELHSRPSVLNPLWYAGAFGLGLVASRAGRARNLGFMAETERQVEEHLDGHLQHALPAQDERSRKVVTQMRDDEIGHRRTAENHGAARLPAPVRLAMRGMSRVMTTTAYRL